MFQPTPPGLPLFSSIVDGAYNSTIATVTTTTANTTAPIGSCKEASVSLTRTTTTAAVVTNTPIAMPVIRSSCSDDVNAILNASAVIDCNVIADAIRLMATSDSDTNSRIIAMEREQKAFHASTTTYFARTAALESKVERMEPNLNNMTSLQERTTRDALTTARAAERGYVSDQVKMSGLPDNDLDTLKRVVQALGEKFGFEVGPEAVTAVRLCSSAPVPDPSGPDELI